MRYLSLTLRLARICCPVVLLFARATPVRALEADYPTRFQAANNAHDPKQAATVLKEWQAAHPDDPEYFIAAANFLLDRERDVSVSTKAAGPTDFVIADASGQKVGSISAATPSAATYHKAIELLKEGLSKAPGRVDIHLGLATLYQESGATDELVKQLAQMAAYANEHPQDLRCKGNEPYPGPAREELSHKISNVARHYFGLETKEGDETFRRLAQLDIDAFPDREYGYNLMGVYYSAIEKDPRRALENFEQALKLVPDDSLVLTNVGVLQSMAGDKEAAIAAFNKVITLNNDPESVRQAQAHLAKLK